MLSFSSFGVLGFLKRLAKSYGVLVGLAITIMLYLFQSAFVLKIVVLGEKNEVSGQIERFVEEILTTRIKGQIDTKKLEGQVRENFAQITSVSKTLSPTTHN